MTLYARLLEYEDISSDVRHFHFEVPEIEKLDFTAGQFVSLSDEVNGKKVTRAYSLAAAPNGNRFELCLNQVKLGTFSPHLFSLGKGEQIPIKGPLGGFTVRDPLNDSVFVATGTGVAPFRAFFQDSRMWMEPREYTLLLGVRSEEGILYREEFEALAKRSPNFRFWPVISRPGETWSGRRGHVQSHLPEAVGDRRDLDVYICGLRDMVNDTRKILTELGFNRKSLIFEKYD